MQKLSILFLTSVLVLSTQVFSAQVLKVKGPSVLINTEGDQIKRGQIYYLITKNNKKKGIVKISKTRPGQAIGKLIKGKALKSWTLRLRSSKKTKKSYTQQTASAPLVKKAYRKKKSRKQNIDSSNKISAGFVLGYNSNSSDVRFLENDGSFNRDDSYIGTSISYAFLLDYKLKKRFYLRTTLGMHNFSTGNSKNLQCRDSDGNVGVACKIDLSYISADAWLRYYLTQGKHKIWAGAGIKLLFSPSSNGTTALDENDLGTEFIPQIGGGIDYTISDKLYVPIWGQYAQNPSTDTVEGSSISGYIGLAYRL